MVGSGQIDAFSRLTQVSRETISSLERYEEILKIYNIGHRDFGENRIQELREKYNDLPQDIKWHMIGHLQKNKARRNRKGPFYSPTGET